MHNLIAWLGTRISSDPFDGRVGRLICVLAGVALVPVSVYAVAHDGGGRVEMVLGTGLAVVLGLHCVMLGLLCGELATRGSRPGVWTRWPEFASYVLGVGLFVAGVLAVGRLGMTAAQLVLGLLVACARHGPGRVRAAHDAGAAGAPGLRPVAVDGRPGFSVAQSIPACA